MGGGHGDAGISGPADIDLISTYVSRTFDEAVILYTSGTTGSPKGAISPSSTW